MITGNEPANAIYNHGGLPSFINSFGEPPTGGLSTGFTIRQHFAVIAMQGLLSNPTLTNLASNEHLCKSACAISNLLIAELNKEK